MPLEIERMEKLIKNIWRRGPGKPFCKAKILRHDIHPEGLDVVRIRFVEAGEYLPNTNVGHIISLLKGSGKLNLMDDRRQSFHVETGVHLYLPPFLESFFDVESGTELLQVSSSSASQTRGKHLLLRDEMFLAACASASHSLRWILTPQYLSRRVFLHHDPVLLSKSGNPVSWFRTTMFDVDGLPKNDEGQSVFKMSYNSRTEFNVCYDVTGIARVRMARHPYKRANQPWGPWLALDSDSTYHLNEAAGGFEEECVIDQITGIPLFLRNKHEVHIVDGHVTLCCMFDPAPTGIERHRPGEYSDYEPLSQVLGTKLYETHQKEISKYDEMLDRLSLAKAMGTLNKFHNTQFWELYVRGRDAQVSMESELAKALLAEGNKREHVIGPWMQTVTDQSRSFT